MIKFFRKIRFDLLEKNKTGKYLKYAIGEIVLVVIGILIALSLNNWNETSKAQRIEMDMLNEIKLSLVRDLEDIDINLKVHYEILKSQNILVDWLANNEEYQDTLAKHFSRINGQTEFISNEGAFETLKSMGLWSLSNDSIRIKLLRIYDIKYKMYREYENYYRTYLEHTIKYVNPEHFELTEDLIVNNQVDIGQGEMKPTDVIRIKKDLEFKYWLKTNRNNNDKFIHFGIKLLISDIHLVINMISEELENK